MTLINTLEYGKVQGVFINTISWEYTIDNKMYIATYKIKIRVRCLGLV